MVVLILFHIAFFYTLYTKPFTMATSELLSTFFPTWLKRSKYDNYWLNTHSHPVLSNYYPISSVVRSLLGLQYRHSKIQKLSEMADVGFCTFLYLCLFHYLLGSIGWFYLLNSKFSYEIALFGALTFTYQAYHIKQQPCIVYTLAWFPFVLMHNTFISSIAVGMVLLAGYYPLAMYLLPVGFILNPDWIAFAVGLLIGLPQIIPFLRYLPKTIRGSVKAPSDSPTETKFYFGLTPIVLLIIHFEWRFLWLFAPIVISYLLRNYLPRVHQRAWLLSVYAVIITTLPLIPQKMVVPLLLLHAFDLWFHNRGLLPPRPYCELPKKPSLAFNNKLTKFLSKNLGDARVAGLPHPLFTGLVNDFKTLGYCGSMQNKLMWKWRKSFKHNPFIDGVNKDGITTARVKYAYSRKELDWLHTPVRHLWLNPEFQSGKC